MSPDGLGATLLTLAIRRLNPDSFVRGLGERLPTLAETPFKTGPCLRGPVSLNADVVVNVR